MKLVNQIFKPLVGGDDVYEEYENEGVEDVAKSNKKRTSTPIVGAKMKTTGVVMFRELFEFKHAADVCEALKGGATVVCNLQRCDDPTIRRILDFLYGTTFVLQGVIQCAGDRIFICAPDTVVLDGQYYADLNEAMHHAKSIQTVDAPDSMGK